MSCTSAICVKLIAFLPLSIALNAIDAFTTLIITASGLITALDQLTTDLLLLFYAPYSASSVCMSLPVSQL